MKKIINIKKQAGFNLIEVLLAFVILSIGLLGVAGLQTTAIKASHTAILKTVAIIKVSEIIERIRANPGADITDYELALGADSVDEECDQRTITPVAAVCSSEDLASNDLFVWEKGLTNGAGLPAVGTDASIVVDDTVTPAVATITVFWVERGENMQYSSMIQQLPAGL